MATVNVNRRLNDDHCRYTMPTIQIKTQGSTIILTNLDEIARKLERPPTYILKYFGYKFSTSVTADEKRNVFAFSGIRSREVLQDHLYKFIDHFVLCSKCENPETTLILQGQRNDEVYKECSACGGSSACKMPAEKITKYIIKDILENGVRRSYDKVEYDEFANETSQDDFSEDDNDDLPADHPLFVLLEDKTKLNDRDTIEKILDTLKENSLIEKGSFLIAKQIFTENIRQEIVNYKNLFQQLCRNNRQAQLNLLSVFETIVINQNMIQTKIINEILFNLYNEDIIDEDTFQYWYRNCSIHRSVRKLAKRFLQWLDQADEENSD